MPLPLEQQPLENIDIEGLVPIIIQTIPVNSMTMILGRAWPPPEPRPPGEAAVDNLAAVLN